MVQKQFSKFDWVLNIDVVETLLRQLQIRDEVIDYVCVASRQVAQSDDSSAFFEFCNSWQAHTTHQTVENFPAKWQALAVVASFPEAMEKHRTRTIPWEVTKATLADFQRDARGEHGAKHAWEFHRLSWMRNHISGNFFEIGRLQYIPGKFGYKFRVYGDSESGKIISFALPGLKCTQQGWPCDDATAFETALEETDEGFVGFPALANGAISSTAKQIPADSKVLLNGDSTVAIIHIPSGGRLDRDDCCQSLHDAKDFFEKYFAEIQIDAFCTATWLLDPELGKVLPDSNIADFGQLFHPLALKNGNDHQLRERVFGDAEWDQCSAENSLQRAILNHHKNGGEFRSTAGFILSEEIY
ncbi:MAG: acyltransferase domain-containing protein [Abditibacteriaceae bacterium]